MRFIYIGKKLLDVDLHFNNLNLFFKPTEGE